MDPSQRKAFLMAVVLLSRAKPQKCDALPIFKQASRIFLGYPLLKKGTPYTRQTLCTCLVNPLTCSEEEWRSAVQDERNRGTQAMYARYRKLICKVEHARRKEEAIAVIPRPSEGVAYVGRIEGPFEITCAPCWGEKYLDLREQNKLDRDDNGKHHIADVVQGWRVEKYCRIDLSCLPGWFRKNTMGRAAIQELQDHPLDSGVTAYQVLDQLLKAYAGTTRAAFAEQHYRARHHRATAPSRRWTLELDDIKMRLVDYLNPSSLENLVVALLQLEHPEEVWQHTGGPGDGGIDGIAHNEAGYTVGLLQVKFSADRPPAFDKPDNDCIQRYVAVLLPEKPDWQDDGAKHLCLNWITRRVKKHWKCLPQAQAMRVGEERACRGSETE